MYACFCENCINVSSTHLCVLIIVFVRSVKFRVPQTAIWCYQLHMHVKEWTRQKLLRTFTFVDIYPSIHPSRGCVRQIDEPCPNCGHPELRSIYISTYVPMRIIYIIFISFVYRNISQVSLCKGDYSRYTIILLDWLCYSMQQSHFGFYRTF